MKHFSEIVKAERYIFNFYLIKTYKHGVGKGT